MISYTLLKSKLKSNFYLKGKFIIIKQNRDDSGHSCIQHFSGRGWEGDHSGYHMTTEKI